MFGITWPAVSAYRICEGAILPAEGGTPEPRFRKAEHCKWARLAGVHRRVRDGYKDGKLSTKAEKVLLEWCNEWGLWGAFLEEFVEVRLPSLYETRQTNPEAEPAPTTDYTVMPVQTIYRREAGRWITVERNEQATYWYLDNVGVPHYDPDAQRAPANNYEDKEGQPVPDADWRPLALLRKLGSDRIEGAKLDDLRVFFPTLAADASIPEPLSPEFWQHYAEPVSSWLRAATWMLDALKEANAGSKQRLEVLSSNGQLRWMGAGKKKGKVEWSAASAMSAMAFGALLELQAGKVRVCQHCRGPFLAKGKITVQRKWCSTLCFQTGNKRKQRKAKKRKAKKRRTIRAVPAI